MVLAFIDKVPFKTDLSPEYRKKAQAQIEHARGIVNQHKQKLTVSLKTGDLDTQKEMLAALLEGKSAHLVAVIQANQRMSSRKRLSLEGCFSLSESLDVCGPITEPVRTWLEPKKKGGHRILYDFGPKHRSAQTVVKNILDVHHHPRPFQFTHIGIKEPIKKAQAFIKEGYIYSARLDVVSFFGSFQFEKLLTELPLPSAAVDHAVTARRLKVEWDIKMLKGASSYGGSSLMNHLTKEAHLGIAPGAVSSPIVGAFCISRLKWPSTSDVVILNYADDFLLLAKSREILAAAVDELIASVGNLPGGSFKLDVKAKRSALQGMSFLGHEMQIKEGNLRTMPSHAAIDELESKLLELDYKLQKYLLIPSGKWKSPEVVQLLARQLSILDGWRSAFSACDDLDRYTAPSTANFMDSLKTFGTTMELVKAAVKPWMAYKPDGYALQ